MTLVGEGPSIDIEICPTTITPPLGKIVASVAIDVRACARSTLAMRVDVDGPSRAANVVLQPPVERIASFWQTRVSVNRLPPLPLSQRALSRLCTFVRLALWRLDQQPLLLRHGQVSDILPPMAHRRCLGGGRRAMGRILLDSRHIDRGRCRVVGAVRGSVLYSRKWASRECVCVRSIHLSLWLLQSIGRRFSSPLLFCPRGSKVAFPADLLC